MQKDIRSLQLRLAGIAEELRELEEIVEAGEPGPEGPAGPQGPAGPTGDDGEGVPTGGTAGQVLAKIDGTDYNTEWVTTSGGGGTLGDLAALDTVGTSEIDDDAVTKAKIAFQAVDSSEIAPDAIVTSKIADLAVQGIKLGDSSVSAAKLANNAVEEAKISNNAVTSIKLANNSVTEPKIAPNSVSEAKLVTASVTNSKLAVDSVSTGKIRDGDVTDAKLAQEYINTTTTTQTKAGNLKVRELGIDRGPFRCNNYTYGDDMPVIDGFIAVPKGYPDNGRGFEFRFDTMQTAYLLHETGATWTQVSGTEPSTYEKNSLFTANPGYFNLYPLRDSNDEWSFEVTGFTLSNSSNNQWKPMLFFHSGSHAINAKVEFLAGDGITWSTAYDDSVTSGVVFPANYAVISQGNLKGLRVTITNLTTNCYLKQVGATSKTSPSFAWQMLKTGGSFYGNIKGRKDGADTWSITQSGAAEFDSVTVEGRPVLPANQFYDSAGGYVYTVYGVNSNWQATRADSSGMLSSAIQTSNLPTALSNVSGLAYS